MAYALRSWPARVGLAMLLAFTASCASGGAAPEGSAAPAAAAGETTLRVHNTDTSGQTLLVYVAPEAGQERLLGEVAPESTLTAPHTGGQGRFLFRAVRPDGSSFNSPVFNVVSGSYTWEIALGRVQRGR